MDGHPHRVGVGLPVPTLDDVAASLGTRLRKWQRSLRWGGTILGCAAMLLRQLLWASWRNGFRDWNESWNRLGVLLPQNMKDIVEGMHVPEERVQNSVVEQIGGVPAPQIWEPVVVGVQVMLQERENRTQEQIVDFQEPRITEAAVEVGRVTPQERVQNRISGSHRVGAIAPHQGGYRGWCLGFPKGGVQNRVTYTGKVFTLCHHCDGQACTVDTVGFIKVLDKHNMPRFEMSWCPRVKSKGRLLTLVGQGSFVKFSRRKLWSGSRIQQFLVEQNMINRKLRLVMDDIPRPRACHGALDATPPRGKRLRAMAVCTFGMCTLARRSGTQRRTIAARALRAVPQTMEVIVEVIQLVRDVEEQIVAFLSCNRLWKKSGR